MGLTHAHRQQTVIKELPEFLCADWSQGSHGAFIFLCRMEHDLVPGLSFSHVATLDECVVVVYL